MMKVFWLLFGFSVLFFHTDLLAQDGTQTQPSSDGQFQATLIKSKVRKQVLTIQIKVVAGSNRQKLRFHYSEVYYTDLNENKKYFGLKDSEGHYIAGPKYDEDQGGRFWEDLEPGQQRMIWIKFPAPPQATHSIDIMFPSFLPFEDIEVVR